MSLVLRFSPMTSGVSRSRYRFIRVLRLVNVWAIVLASSVVSAADLSHETGKIKVSDLNETSGIAASRTNPKTLWLHNDGSSGQLFAVSTTGKLIGIVKCDSAIMDLEDIAIGPGPQANVDYLYLGDIGDNDVRRRDVRVIRFPEPKLAGERGQQLHIRDAEVLRLVYPDGPHDAEALLVDPVRGELIVVTKERQGARIYTIDQKSLDSSTANALKAAGQANANRVSAGSTSPDGSRIILRREDQGWLWQRGPDQNVAAALARKPQKIKVQGKRQGPNGESVCFSPGGDSYFTVSEGKKQAIFKFDLPQSLEVEEP